MCRDMNKASQMEKQQNYVLDVSQNPYPYGDYGDYIDYRHDNFAYLFVSDDLKHIELSNANYPYHQLWNAYSPFEEFLMGYLAWRTYLKSKLTRRPLLGGRMTLAHITQFLRIHQRYHTTTSSLVAVNSLMPGQ